MKRASLKSIAAAAGVSKTTASFVLNGKGKQHKINSATQDRILEEAKRQNYQPSFLAQTLSSGKTMTIGLLLPNAENSISNTLLHHLIPLLQSQHYRLLPGMAQEPAISETEIIEDFILRHTDAIIALQPLLENEWASRLTASQIPLITIYEQAKNASPGTIHYDYVHMINLLIQQHFQNHKKAIGFIGKDGVENQKLQTYITCYIDRFDISSKYHYLLKDAEPIANALEALALQSVNAIMFESPEMARQALQYIRNNHLSNIENIGFSCIGWNSELTFAQPQILGVDYSPSQLARHINTIITAALLNQASSIDLTTNTIYQLYPEK